MQHLYRYNQTYKYVSTKTKSSSSNPINQVCATTFVTISAFGSKSRVARCILRIHQQGPNHHQISENV